MNASDKTKLKLVDKMAACDMTTSFHKLAARMRTSNDLKLDHHHHHHHHHQKQQTYKSNNHHNERQQKHSHLLEQKQMNQRKAFHSTTTTTTLAMHKKCATISSQKINQMRANGGGGGKQTCAITHLNERKEVKSRKLLGICANGGGGGLQRVVESQGDIFLAERREEPKRKRRQNLEEDAAVVAAAAATANTCNHHLPFVAKMPPTTHQEALQNAENCNNHQDSIKLARSSWRPLVSSSSSCKSSLPIKVIQQQQQQQHCWWSPSLSSKGVSSSSASFLLVLICHIVIISLILHKLPSSNQALAAHSFNNDNQNHNHYVDQVYSHQQQQQHETRHKRQHHSQRDISNGRANKPIMLNEEADASGDNLAAAADADHNDEAHLSLDLSNLATSFERQQQQLQQQPARLVARRERRHLVSAHGEFARRPVQAKREPLTSGFNGHQQTAVDCQKLAVFWMFMQSSYPVLSNHLFNWATQVDGRQSDEQFLWAKTPSLARSIGRLLEEAERLMATAQQELQAESSSSSRGLSSQSWMSRVNSNPAYARLIQHLRANKFSRQQSPETKTIEHEHSTGLNTPMPILQTSTPKQVINDEVAIDVTQTGSETVAKGEEQMMASPTQQQQQQQQQQHFGRLVHFPHEIGNAENSNGMARTLDKLRLLNHHARQQQRQQRVNEAELSDIESNRIPQQTVQEDQQQQQQQAALGMIDGSESVDSARNNFVYGKVLLRPQQSNRLPGDDLHERPNPLGTLRVLATEQQRQLLGGKSVIGVGGDSTRPLEDPLTSSPSDSYGRIITSPPSSAADNNHYPRRANHLKHDNSNHRHHHHQQSQEQLGHLAATNQMIETSGPTFDVGFAPSTSFSGSSGGGGGLDELTNQQRSQQAAVSGEHGDSNDEGEDEFEGVFHSGPLKEIEVRQLRSLDHHQQQQQQQQQQNKQKGQERPEVELVTAAMKPQVETTTTSKTEH